MKHLSILVSLIAIIFGAVERPDPWSNRPSRETRPLVGRETRFGREVKTEKPIRAINKIEPILYEKVLNNREQKIPVWVEFIDRPFKNQPEAYINYVKTHSFLPPMDESYIQNVLSLPDVEFLGTSELTNELGVLIQADRLLPLAEQPFVTRIEEMPKSIPAGESIPPYSGYQGVYYNAIDLRNLQEAYSGYNATDQSGDTLGKHIKLTILDTGIYPYHPAFWNSEIRLTPNFVVYRRLSIAARDSFVHLASGGLTSGLLYKRSRDFGINWNQGSDLSPGTSVEPDIATSGNNVYIVGDISGQRDVFFWRSLDNGNTWEGPQNLTNYPENKRAKSPSISAQGDAVYVTWSEWEDLSVEPYFWTRVQFRHSLNQGTNFDPIVLIADTDTTLGGFQDIASENQDVHIVWSQRNPERLSYRKSNNQGGIWNPIEQKPYAGPPYIGGLAVAASGGNAHIAFDLSTPPVANVYYWRPQGDIVTQLTTADSCHHPAIAASDSFVYVTWDDGRDRGNSRPEIYFKQHRNFGATTTNWNDGDEFEGNNNADTTKRISDAPGSSFGSAITATNRIANHIRMVHIAWQDNRNTGYDPEIYYSSSSKIFAWRDSRFPVSPTPFDRQYHGTQVSSVAAGCLVGRTSGNANFNPYLGVAWQGILAVGNICDLTDSTASEASMIEGIKWAVNTIKTDAINMSFNFGPPTGDGTRNISQYVDWAIGQGKLFTNSAGNDGPNPNTVGDPGDNFNAITVGATLRNGTAMANFSSRGPTADGRIKPDVVAPGVDIYVADNFALYTTLYWTNSGTSFAAPMVAGVCALLLEAHPDWTPGAIRKALKNTAAAVTGNPRPNNDEGWGRIQANAARNATINNFPPAILPTAIPYPADSLSGQQGDSVTLWILVKDRECAATPTATVNLTPIGGPSDTIMTGNWVANQWVQCSVRVRIDPTTTPGRKYLKVTTSEGPNGDRDTIWAYININITPMTGIEEGISQIKYPVLLAPKPNPFTNRTEIKFQLPAKTKVELKIYNSIGKAVNTLIAEEMEPGYYTIAWNGKDQYQRTQSNDVYFIRLKTKDYAAIRKLILIR